MTKVNEVVKTLLLVATLAVSIYSVHKVNEVHLTFNSRMTEFIEMIRAASKAEGLKQGREELRP